MALRCDHCQTDNADTARFCAKCGSALLVPRDKDSLLGTVIAGRFRVLSVIGEGGMGRVYRAEQQMGSASRAVAIKVLTTSPTDAKAVKRFHRECATVVSLNHPNTIRFYDFGSLEDQRLYIAMELIEGRSLAKAIAEGPMPYATVDRLVIEIGGALAEANRRGIVHRDLKPDNVLLANHGDEGEHAKVLDFGIAKNDLAGEGDITAAGTIVGTPAYMSPEQLSGKDVDERSDVYALGLMTYEMLTGARPFAGATTPLEWATAHLTKTPRPFDEFPATRVLPVEKRAAVLHALAKEPDQRTPTALRFVEELTGTVRTSLPTTSPGEKLVTGDAPTVQARTPRAAVRTSDSAVKLPASRARYVLYAIGAIAMTIVGAVLTVTAFEGEHGGGSILLGLSSEDAAVAIDGGSDAGPTLEWLHVMTSSSLSDSDELALGPPDGRCAVIRPNGKLLLELSSGIPTQTAGTPSADIEIVVRDGNPYRVDVEVDRHSDAFTNIGAEIVGTTAIDVDQFDVHELRYVRVKNPSRTSLVCVDAVGVFVDRPATPAP